MIVVYGKPDCGKCTDFKDKLLKLGLVEGADWTAYDCTDLETKWKHGGATRLDTLEAMSALQLVQGKMPAVDIDGRVYAYAGAIKAIKQGKRNEDIG